MMSLMDSAAASRIRSLESALQHERAQRVRLAQEAAGLRSANLRLKAMVLDHKAKERRR